MTKVQLRNAWLQVHKWVGLLLAIILVPLSLTGSMLVWDEPLDRLLEPSHYTASGPAALPASAYVEAARRALPAGSNLVSVRIGKIRDRRVTSHTSIIVNDAVRCGRTPGRRRTPLHEKSSANAASSPTRSGTKLNDSRPFQNAKILSRSWKNSRPDSVSRPPDEIAMWKCDRDPAIAGV